MQRNFFNESRTILIRKKRLPVQRKPTRQQRKTLAASQVWIKLVQCRRRPKWDSLSTGGTSKYRSQFRRPRFYWETKSWPIHELKRNVVKPLLKRKRHWERWQRSRKHASQLWNVSVPWQKQLTWVDSVATIYWISLVIRRCRKAKRILNERVETERRTPVEPRNNQRKLWSSSLNRSRVCMCLCFCYVLLMDDTLLVLQTVFPYRCDWLIFLLFLSLTFVWIQVESFSACLSALLSCVLLRFFRDVLAILCVGYGWLDDVSDPCRLSV